MDKIIRSYEKVCQKFDLIGAILLLQFAHRSVEYYPACSLEPYMDLMNTSVIFLWWS